MRPGKARRSTLCSKNGCSISSACCKITDTLSIEGISYELIGGLAVLVHVEEANPEYTTLTRDVDLMVCRSDLERIKEIGAKNGFRFRLVFSGERVRPEQAMPNPPIAPEKKRIHGKEIMIIRYQTC